MFDRGALNDARICDCPRPRADVNAKNPEKRGCCSIASATRCQRRRTKQLVEKNWNSPKSRQQSIAGATAADNVIAQGAPVGNRLRRNQESPDPRPRLVGAAAASHCRRHRRGRRDLDLARGAGFRVDGGIRAKAHCLIIGGVLFERERDEGDIRHPKLL